jgi:hypothetical protein
MRCCLPIGMPAPGPRRLRFAALAIRQLTVGAFWRAGDSSPIRRLACIARARPGTSEDTIGAMNSSRQGPRRCCVKSTLGGDSPKNPACFAYAPTPGGHSCNPSQVVRMPLPPQKGVVGTRVTEVAWCGSAALRAPGTGLMALCVWPTRRPSLNRGAYLPMGPVSCSKT